MNRFAGLLVIIALLISQTAFDFNVPRAFTDVNGRKVTANLLAVTSTHAMLKLQHGQVHEVALASLTAQDQAYAAAMDKQSDQVPFEDIPIDTVSRQWSSPKGETVTGTLIYLADFPNVDRGAKRPELLAHKRLMRADKRGDRDRESDQIKELKLFFEQRFYFGYAIIEMADKSRHAWPVKNLSGTDHDYVIQKAFEAFEAEDRRMSKGGSRARTFKGRNGRVITRTTSSLGGF